MSRLRPSGVTAIDDDVSSASHSTVDQTFALEVVEAAHRVGELEPGDRDQPVDERPRVTGLPLAEDEQHPQLGVVDVAGARCTSVAPGRCFMLFPEALSVRLGGSSSRSCGMPMRGEDELEVRVSVAP